jgi:acyl carrier protein
MPGHELVIVDPVTSLPRGDNQVGEILLRGPSVAQGYWNRPAETAETFAARIDGLDGTFLRTGDLGFISDGELYVTGRLKDVIIIRGRNHYPQDIEQTVQNSHAAILHGAAFSVSIDGEEQLVVVHQVERQYRQENCAEVIRAVRRAIVESHELDPYAIVLIRQTSLPITSSGKVQRSLCREQYLSGELKVVDRWIRPPSPARSALRNGSGAPAVANGHLEWRLDSNGIRLHSKPEVSNYMSAIEIDRAAERIETWLLEWLVERVGLDPSEVERNRPFAEYGVDSLTSVELSHELEAEFGVELTPIVAWNHPTPEALARYLAGQSMHGEMVQLASKPMMSSATHAGNGHKSTAPAADWEKMLEEIEQLSDEEATKLLEP